MIQCQISVLHIIFQGRSVLCVVLFTWLNLGCNNYFKKIYTDMNIAVLTVSHIALISRQFGALGEPRPRPVKSICSLTPHPIPLS